jgi:hypothetical protein
VKNQEGPYMIWYSAHLVIYLKLLNKTQQEYPVQESVVLIGAESVEAAYAEAERIGKTDFEEDALTTPTLWDDQPARWVFGGVRKLVECHDVPSKGTKWDQPDKAPEHGTELTYSKMLVESEQDLEKLIKNDLVKVWYQDE